MSEVDICAGAETAGQSIMPGESTKMTFFNPKFLRTLSWTCDIRALPKLRSPMNPKSGSPTRAGPSWSVSSGPEVMSVKQSSVGATPLFCTSAPTRKLTKDDFPDE
eukprot:CAMPEP_0179429754 /NCGR_PEP_ID=MMETSP0799-20121207/15045_2 /TAXON_ID=46947 /ORGANISM="Geminigera cryophila, Strain CCMP2564" /LENGTH=105 /DNA_ID=CAMNT_0021205803 /DNA_START=1603 /DNA_END=1920 /DNA_ORIENTATION=-